MTLWTKDFVILFASKLLTSIVFTLLTASIASYSMIVLSVDSAIAGLISGIFILSSVVGRIYAGANLEKVGHRKMLIWSGFALFVASCFYLLPFNAIGLLLIRLIHGAIHGIASNTVTAVVTINVPKGRMGEGLSYLSLCTTASLAIGPFVGLNLLQSGNYLAMFVLCALLTFFSFILLPFMDNQDHPKKSKANGHSLNEPILQEIESEAEATKRNFRSIFNTYFEKKAIIPSTVVLLLCISSSSLTAFIEPYTVSVGLGVYSSYFFLVYALVMFISRPLMGKVMDKRGIDVIAYPTMVLFAISLLIICIPNVPSLFAAAVLAAIGYGGFFPCCQTASVRDVSPERIGIATSTYFGFTDVGLGMGPLMGGIAIESFDYVGMFIICAVLVVLALIFFFFASRHQRNRKRLLSDCT